MSDAWLESQQLHRAKSTTGKRTDTIAEWILKDHKLVNIVVEKGFTKVLYYIIYIPYMYKYI